MRDCRLVRCEIAQLLRYDIRALSETAIEDNWRASRHEKRSNKRRHRAGSRDRLEGVVTGDGGLGVGEQKMKN
jgi:hypothetical protein